MLLSDNFKFEFGANLAVLHILHYGRIYLN